MPGFFTEKIEQTDGPQVCLVAGGEIADFVRGHAGRKRKVVINQAVA